MNNTINMLSAKKVKLHGMSTIRWTARDKIFQYKGLINLYKRDRKIMENDIRVAQRKQRKEINAMQKNIKDDREELMNAIQGDRQTIRNTLADHRDILLALERAHPKQIIEHVHQIGFTKRKEYDKLQYEMKRKSQTLVDLKLKVSILEDRIRYNVFKQTNEEKQAEIISGKVQDAILRKEAAIAIRQIYNEIIDIMKKDALYFDAILVTIKNDGLLQSKCMINAIELGQLATEYLDDRKQEYATLEKIVIKDMKQRKKDLDTIEKRLGATFDTLRNLLRRDSDINLCFIKLEKTQSDTNLEENVHELETVLTFLKETTLVESFEAIYPCLQEQMRQRERLVELTRKFEKSRDIIMNKLDHAELMDNILKNTMVETTKDYKNAKKEIHKALLEERENQINLEDLITHKKNLIAKVRCSLRQLQQLLLPIKEEKKNKIGEGSVESEETDGTKMIPLIANKLNYLMTSINDQLDGQQLETAYQYYEEFILSRCETLEAEHPAPSASLLQVTFEEISHVLTREDIKRISDELVTEYTKSNEM